MTYELAKQLKDAGFPYKWDRYPLYVTDPNSTSIGKVGSKDDLVVAPTLEELIEACGAEFNNLAAPTERHRYWEAWSKIQMLQVYGSSPSEAVAALWLALNKPLTDQGGEVK